MKKRWILGAGLLALACILTACGAQTEQGADSEEPPVETEQEAVSTGGEPAATGGTALDMLPGLDVSGLKAAMPEADYRAFEDYLPVLRGEETFCWVAGPYDGHPDYNWESFDADMTAVRDKFWDGYGNEVPETLTLDCLAVQDIDGDGGAELILLFQDGAYNYLILHREEAAVYGTSLYIRWFESLQKNGVYIGAGGAGYSTYYRMAFPNGRFEDQELGVKIDGASVCYRELDGQEVTEAVFDAWLAENMVGDAAWYQPDGTPSAPY